MSRAPVTIKATSQHTATMVFLHGLGDFGKSWAGILAPIIPSYMSVLLPDAPTQVVSISGGLKMPSWFDMKVLDSIGPEDNVGIELASHKIEQLLEKQELEPNRLMVGGFSQGGALALHAALTHSRPLAGVIALSGWLPTRDQFPARAMASREVPIFLAHGTDDTVVPLRWAQESADVLRKCVRRLTFKTYPDMVHTYCEDELDDIRDFILKVCPPEDAL